MEVKARMDLCFTLISGRVIAHAAFDYLVPTVSKRPNFLIQENASSLLRRESKFTDTSAYWIRLIHLRLSSIQQPGPTEHGFDFSAAGFAFKPFLLLVCSW
jgi:hypothetical protein